MSRSRPCCGEARRAVSLGISGARGAVRSATLDVSSPVTFEYVGATALSVDGRDAFGLATVPILRRVRE